MHYRTELIDFLGEPDEFLAEFEAVVNGAPGGHQLSRRIQRGPGDLGSAAPVIAVT